MLYDVIIIGAGAAGMFAAIHASKLGKSALVLEHNREIGNKILISGGGRCNFTNYNAKAENYLSDNPNFVKSILSQYSANDFVNLVEQYGIEYYEKKLGQLFCKKSSREIINMLLSEANKCNVIIKTSAKVKDVDWIENKFKVLNESSVLYARNLVVACGGLSFPKKGATDLGYKIAKKFGHNLIPTRPALVPLTLNSELQSHFTELSGISFDSIAKKGKVEFRENTLITHKGLSGPAILQISSYLKDGEEFILKIEPSKFIYEAIEESRGTNSSLKSILNESLSTRLSEKLCQILDIEKTFNQTPKANINKAIEFFQSWKIKPIETGGYDKAEVTIGGVDTRELEQKTMESKKQKGLYFIGEVVDVTGWLGGYNFQWAWSSGFVCGRAIGSM